MKEQTICKLIGQAIKFEKRGEIYTNVVYDKGEMDILHIDKYNIHSYYEIKSTNREKYRNKAISQIERAMKYGICHKGYVITPEEMFQVFIEK